MGNWQEIPAGLDVERACYQEKMSTRYAGDSTVTSADAKARVLLALLLCRMRMSSTDLSLDQLRSAQITWTTVESLELPTSLLKFEVDVPVTEMVESETEGDSDEAESDSSDDSGGLDVIPCFQQPSSKTYHLIQDQANTLFVPWCKESPCQIRHAGLHITFWQ